MKLQVLDKVCYRCKERKPVNDFYQFKTGKYHTYCLECVKEKDKERYDNNGNNLRKKKAAWKRIERKNNIEKALLRERNRYKVRKLENSAMSKVRLALISGKLKKPKYCRSCGQEIALQAHHRDYNKPLEVIWLCSGCHGFLHSYLALKAGELLK